MTGTRLNDCTLTPDEQARYAEGVTDEREAALQTFARMNEVLARVTDERDAARAEIAKLRAPPEADVIEIAWVTLGYTADPAWIINDPQRFPDVHSVAQALTAYGDQRAGEARAAAIEECLNLARRLSLPTQVRNAIRAIGGEK